ncbi:hypothetical protein SB861_65375, partial [Paraburkholderia sp. SIMBA_049]
VRERPEPQHEGLKLDALLFGKLSEELPVIAKDDDRLCFQCCCWYCFRQPLITLAVLEKLEECYLDAYCDAPLDWSK